MPAPYHTNVDGSIREFSPAEVTAMDISTRNVKTGDHPVHTREYGQSTIRRSFFCAWSELEAFIAYMLGAVKVYHDAGLGRDALSRLMPQTFPGKPNFVCTKLEQAKGFGCGTDDEDKVPEYDFAVCDFLYEDVPFSVLADDATPAEYLRYTIDLPSSSDVAAIVLPGSTLKFRRSGGAEPDGRNVPYNTALVDCQSIITKRWVRVPKLAYSPGSVLFERIWGAADGSTIPYVGTINSNGLFGFAPGTLLLQSVEDEVKHDAVDGDCVDLTLRWAFRPRGHLKYYFPALPGSTAAGYYFAGRGAEQTADVLDDGNAMLNSRNHRALFQVG